MRKTDIKAIVIFDEKTVRFMVKIMLDSDTASSVRRMDGRTQVPFLKKNHVSSEALFRFISP